jgi:hypothetical protein
MSGQQGIAVVAIVGILKFFAGYTSTPPKRYKK